VIERWHSAAWTSAAPQSRERGRVSPGGILTPEKLGSLGLNERQMMAVLYIKEHGADIGNTKYQEISSSLIFTRAAEDRKQADLPPLTPLRMQ
jgi:hypothetical protein